MHREVNVFVYMFISVLVICFLVRREVGRHLFFIHYSPKPESIGRVVVGGSYFDVE